jgi:hypothetical protein
MAEGAIVSHRSVPIHLRLVQEGGDRKSTTFGELTSRKSLALGVVPRDSTEVWGEIHMNRERVGEERRGK